jgi:uncharacterized Tic20 family protein
MTKIIGFRDRLRSLGFGIVATVETILYVILIILVAITKAIFYIISFFYIILAVLSSVALLYELAVNYWDGDNYPYKLFEDICNWLEKPWVK